jgi:UDP-N-acetyl-D-glucosamine 2-epimerase, UDP-hydrolysing
MSNIITKEKFDSLLLLGDRFEMAAVAMTATPFKIPIIHFHGGAVTTGSFDDNFRHSITKLSNYHMVETVKHKKRIMQMGENKSNIRIIGAPSLSDYKSTNFSLFKDISNKLELFENKFIILNLHPETNENLTYNKKLIDNVLRAIKNYNGKVIITAPNGDIYNNMIIKKYHLFFKKYKHKNKFIYKKHLGHELYFTLLKKCHYLMGNSSSGIIEAASFKKPVVNIGGRQMNREYNSNVIHSDIEYEKNHFINE